MKKLQLRLNNKQMLSKEHMKTIGGGQDFTCYAIGTSLTVTVVAGNCCEAQGWCDAVAWSNAYTSSFPEGCDCPCDMNCS